MSEPCANGCGAVGTRTGADGRKRCFGCEQSSVQLVRVPTVPIRRGDADETRARHLRLVESPS